MVSGAMPEVMDAEAEATGGWLAETIIERELVAVAFLSSVTVNSTE